MKNLVISFIFLLYAFKAVSQNAPDLKFDQNFTSCEKKWVAFQPDATLRYPYGFIYVDMSAGFTFDLKGFISVQADGKFVADNTISKNGSTKYRLAPGTKPVAVLPSDRLKELNLKPEPEWLSIYYSGVKDTTGVYYNYRMGWIYNAAGESGIALKYLEKAYRGDPADDKVKFEMVFAYNALGRFDDAIKLLEVDIKNKPKDFNLYKELGYAYGGAKKFDKAIEIFKKGLSLFPDNVRSDQRGEMALNTAMAYKDLNNMDEYKKWMLLAKDYYPAESPMYKRIVASGF
jgi:tetratricopeptide (TPR) repeat protein